jgi:hypothetical protein
VVEAFEKELARHGGDFDAFAEERLSELKPRRLNNERIARLHTDNPEIHKLQDLADGMPVETDPDFIPNSGIPDALPRLRQLFIKTHKAFDRMIYDLVEDGLAVILRLETALQIPGIHFSPGHWAPKAGKRHGRPIIDSTDANSQFPVLNTDYVARWAETRWGEIKNPTIVDIAIMICSFKATHPELTWEDLALFKMDLKGAYTLLSFRAASCKLMAVQLVGGLVVIFLCGLFGWAATPAAFQVVTRAILFELARQIFGAAAMYVDDIIAVTSVAAVKSDLKIAEDICTDLLGPGAVAQDKTVSTADGLDRRVDVIGYTIDLDQRTVTLTRRNFLKTIYAFFACEPTEPVSVSDIERMAALASRYSAILQELRPFSRALHACIRGITNRRARVLLSDEARLSVQLWRTMLCTAYLDEARFARPLEHFTKGAATFVLQFDASLEGIGILIYRRDPATGAEALVGGSTVPLEQMGFGEDSSFQNTAEFLAIVVGLIGVLRLSRAGERVAVMLRGDSVTALTWAETARFRSDRATRAAVAYVLLLSRQMLQVTGVVHLAAALNQLCDDLSRKGRDGRYRRVQDVVPGATDLQLEDDQVVEGLLEACNPRLEPLGLESFTPFWSSVAHLIAGARRGA